MWFSFSDMQDKIEVNGDSPHPLYRYMKAVQPTSLPGGPSSFGKKGEIEWNYTKFLINRHGQPIRRYRSVFDPLNFEGDVQLALADNGFLTPEECLLKPELSQCSIQQYL
ncbi:unnamed protein product [Ostreobium quekettii]|uniref:Glutathione peroxidase n=1 Tax=Ostreobium quekettii TaxID=121088 RepID=A0A8S1INZ1_9CHLO|nr:unnamed protein product [Ostreobium quekettii]|eukprot:evm.model.scf_121.2 EVM.evm.TU.scf_121.2   scf_121:19364-20288(-)